MPLKKIPLPPGFDKNDTPSEAFTGENCDIIFKAGENHLFTPLFCCT